MNRGLRLLAALALAALAALGPALPAAGAAPAAAGAAGRWTAAWASPMAWGYGEADQTTVRQVVPLTAGGSALRVRISNAFGNAPLQIGAATVGVQLRGASLVAGSLRRLSFAGRPAVTVPKGGLVTSDPLPYATHDGEVIEVSVYMIGRDLVSVHPCCVSTPFSYFTGNGAGDRTAALSGGAFAYSSQWSRWVDSVDVLGGAPGVVAAFGDSITDGFNTKLRWTDVLVRRLDALPPGERPAVINEGITANTAGVPPRSYATVGGGPPGTQRFTRDVLEQPGLRYVVVLLGTNDLWFGGSTQEVEGALADFATAARRAGVEPIAVTLLPRAGSEGWTPAMEAEREAVNAWLRHSPTYPVVLDWAHVVADRYNGACNARAMFPPFDSGDHLHPDPAGQTAMADALPTRLIGAPATAPAPALVKVTPTRGCALGPAVIYHPAADVHSPSPSPSPSAATSPSRPATPAPDSPSPRAAAVSSTSAAWYAGAGAAVLLALGVGWMLGRRAGRR